MPYLLLLLIILVLSIYASHLKAIKDRFIEADPNIYSASVIATTNSNSITSPTRINLHDPNEFANAKAAPLSTSAQVDSAAAGTLGLQYYATSSNVLKVLRAVQDTVASSQREGCAISAATFAEQKEEILKQVRAKEGGIRCSELQQIVFQQLGTQDLSADVRLAVTRLWDTVAFQVCDSTGIVNVDKLDVLITSLYRSLCS